MGKKKPFLTICAIFRDEEQQIPGFIQCFSGLCDHWVLVDTGSEDQSCEILQKKGIKPFFFEWCDDFSKAKNFALDQALGEWILILDLDERMDKKDQEALLCRLYELSGKETGIEGIFLPVISLDSQDFESGREKVVARQNRLCLIRNKKKYRFCYPIHERLDLSLEKEGALMVQSSEIVWHTGYHCSLNEKKIQRNTRILLKALEQSPKDPHLLLYKISLLWGEHCAKELDEVFCLCESQVDLSLKVSILGLKWAMSFCQEQKEKWKGRIRSIHPRSAFLALYEAREFPMDFENAKKNYLIALEGISGELAEEDISVHHEIYMQLIKIFFREGNFLRTLELISCMERDYGIQKVCTPFFLQSAYFLNRFEEFQKRFDLYTMHLGNKKTDSDALQNSIEKMKKEIEKKKLQRKRKFVFSRETPKISVCAIMKNEEFFLDGFLDCLNGFCNELIILDTGSKDQSLEILRQKNIPFREFLWQNDFSLARNESLSHATGDWLLVLDIDDRIDEKDFRRLRIHLQNTSSDALFFSYDSLLDFDWEDGSKKLFSSQKKMMCFRNGKGYFYQGKIHENPLPSMEEKGALIENFPISIWHLGYVKELLFEKTIRNRKLIEESFLRGDRSASMVLNWCLLNEEKEEVSELLDRAFLQSVGELQLRIREFQVQRAMKLGKEVDQDWLLWLSKKGSWVFDFYRANQFFLAQDLQNSLNLYEKLANLGKTEVTMHRNLPEILYRLSFLKASVREYEFSLQILDNLEKRYGLWPESWHLKLKILAVTSQWDQARGMVKTLPDLSSLHPDKRVEVEKILSFCKQE